MVDFMTARPTIKKWMTKWIDADGKPPVSADQRHQELHDQMVACLKRLDHIDSQFEATRQILIDREALLIDREERLRQESEALGVHLEQAQQRVADRERLIEELNVQVRSHQEQLAALATTAQSAPATDAAEPPSPQPTDETAKAVAYRELRRAIAVTVERVMPAHATVLVVSRGDDRLLELGSRRGWHFPRAEDGRYLGYHPHDSAAAIAHLEELRASGAEYLLFPATARWWLDHYKEFTQHLETKYTAVPSFDDSCVIFALVDAAISCSAAPSTDDTDPYRELDAAIETFRAAFRRSPGILDWNSPLHLASRGTYHSAFSPPANGATLPYLDGTIDVVVCGPTDAERAEARRVAQRAVVCVDHDPPHAVAIEWIANGAASALDASIIIPCHNGAAITEACLGALTASLPRGFTGQIIVFDDASTDDTRQRLKAWTKRDARIRLKWRNTNGGFIEVCNRAAKDATGEYLVFLNNDTEPSPGWLTALLDTFRRFPRAGAVGGKLILPDGTLQEAGSVIFRDGSAANFMRGEANLAAPIISYVREVDYCSGALLATPRELFESLGGFDAHYRPAYYEDVDYCFRVRQAGGAVYYQPASTAIHREGASCGTDVTRGVKRYQLRNRHKFAQRWKTVLQRQPVRPADNDVSAWRALAEWRHADVP